MTTTALPAFTAFEPYLWLGLVILFVGLLGTFAVYVADAWLNDHEVPVTPWRLFIIGLTFYGIYLASRPDHGRDIIRAVLDALGR